MHYLPLRYPILLLVEREGLEPIRRALSEAGFLAVSPRAIADIWKSEPKQPVVVLKPVRQFHGIQDSELASPERAFLDLLYEVRHHGFPFPQSAVRALWDEMSPGMKERVVHLGRYLRFRPFYQGPGRARVRDELGVARP